MPGQIQMWLDRIANRIPDDLNGTSAKEDLVQTLWLVDCDRGLDIESVRREIEQYEQRIKEAEANALEFKIPPKRFKNVGGAPLRPAKEGEASVADEFPVR